MHDANERVFASFWCIHLFLCVCVQLCTYPVLFGRVLCLCETECYPSWMLFFCSSVLVLWCLCETDACVWWKCRCDAASGNVLPKFGSSPSIVSSYSLACQGVP
ncbi:unnamed protein product [Ectocarpus sp. 8 AP-2014]